MANQLPLASAVCVSPKVSRLTWSVQPVCFTAIDVRSGWVGAVGQGSTCCEWQVKAEMGHLARATEGAQASWKPEWSQKSCALGGPRRTFPGQQPCPLKQRRGASGQTEERQDNYRKFPETCFKQTNKKNVCLFIPSNVLPKPSGVWKCQEALVRLRLSSWKEGGGAECVGGLRPAPQAAGPPSEGASGRGAAGLPCPSLSSTEEVRKPDYSMQHLWNSYQGGISFWWTTAWKLLAFFLSLVTRRGKFLLLSPITKG